MLIYVYTYNIKIIWYYYTDDNNDDDYLKGHFVNNPSYIIIQLH